MGKFKPSKRLGQIFLIDRGVVKKVISEFKKNQELSSPRGAKLLVLEIGPGLGALTQELAKLPVYVLAVEKDSRLCQILGAKLQSSKNVKIVNQDILKFQISNYKFQINSKSKIQNYKIIASLPFYITAPVIKKFLGAKLQPKEMILIIQKEVAQRICAKPPRMNLLAVSVQFYATPKIISYVSKKSFRPLPKVDAAIIKIIPHKKNEELSSKLELSSSFFKIVKAGFSHPRKQLVNNLLVLNSSNGLKLNKSELSSQLMACGIKPSQRAETLSIEDWIKLSNMLK